jgi:hypothetical protein
MSSRVAVVVGLTLGLGGAQAHATEPAAASPAVAPSAAAESPDALADVGALAVYVDDGVLLESVGALLAGADEAVRIALLVDDVDAGRQRSVERALVRVLRSRRREDVVTPALVRARAGQDLPAGADAASSWIGAGFAADHVLLGQVVDSAGSATLQLRLFSTARGAVVATEQVALAAPRAASTARTVAVGVAADEVADLVAEAVEAGGVNVRAHRIGVPPVVAAGAAAEARLDRFLQGELTRALQARGFLVVERGQLRAAMDQLALQQLAGSDKVGELGALLGAQSLLLAQVNDAGDHFVVTARVVAVENARVLGAVAASVPREGVVSLAAVETRTPAEAALRSAIAPGWGQAYNREGGKAVLFGVTTYGALLGTLGLGAGALASWSAYDAVGNDPAVPAVEAQQQAVSLRQQTNTLLTTTAVAGALTATVWSLGVADALISAPRED